ncbi:MAG TPA: hypothetical protein VI197_05270 [Polyangiaceae bacterium]
MRLLRLQVSHLGPFERERFSFSEPDAESGSDNLEAGAPLAGRAVTVIHGPGGVGKTTLLSAIAATRPGALSTLHQRRARTPDETVPEAPAVVADWALGQDDPERPHTLTLATPGARAFADDQQESLRRREQTLFDKVAREGGFAWAVLPAHRWFSRQPILLGVPSRVASAYDTRQHSLFDDAARADLTRDTKQLLAYAAIGAALERQGQLRVARRDVALRALGDATREVVDGLVRLAGYTYRGLDPASLEPEFTTTGGARGFDELPTQVRHLAAMGALSLRAMWLARPERDPRDTEGVVAIDEIDLHQDPAVQALLVPSLRELLPNVQWIVTTQSGGVAGSAATHEVLALRRLPEHDRVEVYSGSDARTH